MAGFRPCHPVSVRLKISHPPHTFSGCLFMHKRPTHTAQNHTPPPRPVPFGEPVIIPEDQHVLEESQAPSPIPVFFVFLVIAVVLALCFLPPDALKNIGGFWQALHNLFQSPPLPPPALSLMAVRQMNVACWPLPGNLT